MQSSNGTIHTLERKDRIKYLGEMLDETVSFKYHIAYVMKRLWSHFLLHMSVPKYPETSE